MLLQNIAVCVPDVHKPASLPGAANCGVRSWPRLPSILKDNLLTSNGLSSFCLSPCGNQRVFLSIPLPPSSFPSEMLKHLVASKQGQTTNTWMSIFFFLSPPSPRSAATWQPDPGGCEWHLLVVAVIPSETAPDTRRVIERALTLGLTPLPHGEMMRGHDTKAWCHGPWRVTRRNTSFLVL